MLAIDQIHSIRISLSSYGSGMGEILLVLLITAAVFVSAWLAARFLARRSMQTRRHGQMQIVDRQALGKDRQVVLLKVGTEHYLIGMSQNCIQFSNPVKPAEFSTLLAEKEQQTTADSNLPGDYSQVDSKAALTVGQRLDRLIAFMKQNGRPGNPPGR